MPNLPVKIFISYRRTDSPGHVGRLSDSLIRTYGEGSVFKDVTSIAGGADFYLAINEAIRNATVIIVAVGPWWSGKSFLRRSRIHKPDDWVRLELEAARRNGKHILPVLVNNGRMPIRPSLPSSIKFFSTLNAALLRDESWEADFSRLLKELEGIISRPAPQVEQEAEAVGSNVRFSRRRILGLLLAPLTGLSVWGLWRVTNRETQPLTPLAPRFEPHAPILSLRIKRSDSLVYEATGFHISSRGHIFTLLGKFDGAISCQAQTYDGREYAADLIAKTEKEDLSLMLLKLSATSTPHLQIATREPQATSSILISGVDAASTTWRSYAARVEGNSDGDITYKRPEPGWLGLMGAPIIDVQDNVAVGVHVGTSLGANSDIDHTVAHGKTFKMLGLEELLKQAGIAAKKGQNEILNIEN